MNTQLKVDPEFEKIIPSLTEDEFKQLEANILSEGEVFTPIFVWNGLIVDGHHRYKILQKYPEIKCRISERDFENRYAAIAWICNNQLGRRNLSDLQKTMLVGRRFEAEKLIYGDRRSNVFSCVQSERVKSGRDATAQILANELGISTSSVKRAGEFVRGLDAAEDALPGIEGEIISGQIRPAKREVAAIAKAPPEARRQMAEDLRLTPEEKKKRKEQREVLKSIEEISAELARPKERNDVDNVLGIISGAADAFQKTCSFYLDEFPELLDTGRPRLIEAVGDLEAYINCICSKEKLP